MPQRFRNYSQIGKYLTGLNPYAHKLARTVSFKPTAVAEAYSFPTDVTGAGQTIGLVELGGGFLTTDLNAAGVDPSRITFASVDGGANTFDGVNGASGEVALDIQIAALMAPGANIRVYFAPNTDQGFVDILAAANSDKVNALSCSWGGPENSWITSSVSAMEAQLELLAANNITFTCAAGDNGASDGESGLNLDYPGSSLYSLMCGGTTLTLNGGRISEKVWNDGSQGGATGGGVSSLFGLPSWQEGLTYTTTGFLGKHKLTKRGGPDVAGNADPDTGYVIYCGGEEVVFGGTSAVAPLWASLIALLNQKMGKNLGHISPKIYGSLSALNNVSVGNNGKFTATANPQWDACTGCGTPNGKELELVLG